jgi:LacI family transcriptional regulator
VRSTLEKRFVTIHDVAADAKVSTATVSRVLNEPWRVSQTARERVGESIARLGYTPNLRARLLARGDSGTICFLLSNRPFLHSVHTQMLQGAADMANGLGVQIVYATCAYSPDAAPSEIEMPHILAARGLIDGVIVAGTNYPNMLRALDELDLPRVLFGTNFIGPDAKYPPYPSHLSYPSHPSYSFLPAPGAVYVDDESGGYQATAHLISLGHQSIRFIGDVSLPWYRRRYEGYVSAMSEAGIEPSPPVGTRDAAEKSVTEFAMGVNAANDLAERGDRFTALFAGGDMAAIGAMRALAGRGIRVPDDVSVVGFNDEEAAEIAEPPLTTIHVLREEIGARCVEMLRAMLETGERPEATTLPVRLIVRESTCNFQLSTCNL